MKKIIFFTGAGISAESGISTFRDKNGLWYNFDPSQVCTIRNFKVNYEMVHEFYNKRRKELEHVTPNQAHKALAQLQNKYGTEKIIIITTNVDDLLERAGCREVLHLHGNLKEVIYGYPFIEATVKDIGYSEVDATKHPKDSVDCCKPNVIFFGEAAPEYENYHTLLYSLKENDLFISIGSSDEVVHSILDANYFSSEKNNTIFVNPDKTKCQHISELSPNTEIHMDTACQYFENQLSKIESALIGE